MILDTPHNSGKAATGHDVFEEEESPKTKLGRGNSSASLFDVEQTIHESASAYQFAEIHLLNSSAERKRSAEGDVTVTNSPGQKTGIASQRSEAPQTIPSKRKVKVGSFFEHQLLLCLRPISVRPRSIQNSIQESEMSTTITIHSDAIARLAMLDKVRQLAMSRGTFFPPHSVAQFATKTPTVKEDVVSSGLALHPDALARASMRDEMAIRAREHSAHGDIESRLSESLALAAQGGVELKSGCPYGSAVSFTTIEVETVF